MRVQPSQPDGMDMNTVNHPAPGSISLLGRVGHGTHASLTAGFGDGGSSTQSRAGGGVDLVGMVHLDHLGRLEVTGCHGCESVSQDCGDGEVWSDENAEPRMSVQGLPDLVQALLGPTGSADDGVDPLPYQSQGVAQDGIGTGEIDRHIRVARIDGSRIIVRAQQQGRLHILCVLQSTYHLGSHASACAQHRYANHRLPPSRLFISFHCAFSVFFTTIPLLRLLAQPSRARGTAQQVTTAGMVMPPWGPN